MNDQYQSFDFGQVNDKIGVEEQAEDYHGVEEEGTLPSGGRVVRVIEND